MLYSFGENPALKNSIISTKYSSEIYIEKSCALGKFSSKLLGSVPLVILDR
jgi:hypothetical protein